MTGNYRQDRPAGSRGTGRSRGRALGGLALVLFVLGGICLAPAGRTATEVGAARKVVREVYGNSLNRRMQQGERLVFRQKVRTGAESAASLAFLDDSRLAIGANSQVTLDEFIYQPARNLAQGTLNLVRGVLRFASGSVKLDLRIKTPSATIGIRGTVFDVLASATLTEVAVRAGSVLVETPAGTRTVARGEVVVIERGRAPAPAAGASARFRQAVAEMLGLIGPAEAAGLSTDRPRRTARPAATPARLIAGKDLDNLLYLDLAHGRVVIEMRPDLAPRHVARIKQLTREGFYDGLSFHNVVHDFAAETGDPTGTGRGGSGQRIAAEFSDEPFRRGSVGMKHKRRDPASADSQFFISLAPAPHLDGRYTLWGRVIFGIELLDRLRPGQPPKYPDRIVSLRVAADVTE